MTAVLLSFSPLSTTLPSHLIHCTFDVAAVPWSTSTMSSSTTSSALPLSLLLSVLSRVPGVLTLITPYLYPRHKLTELSRVCRAFPPLSAACFRHDLLDLSDRTAVVLPLLSRSAATLSLLSQVRHVRCVYSVDEEEGAAVNNYFLAIFHPPPSIAAASSPYPFTALRSLSLTVPSENASFVRQLFAHCPSRFPTLTTLDIGCESTDDELLPLDVEPLCDYLPSLTSLSLRSCTITRRSFALLSSLPLVKLDCTDQCDVFADGVDIDDRPIAASAESDAPVPSSKLRVLLLPSLHPTFEGERSQFKLVDRLLTVCATADPPHNESEETRDEEEDDVMARLPRGLVALQLFNERMPIATLRIISQLRTLTWLDLSDCYVQSLAPLLDDNDGPQLHALRHFDAPLCMVSAWAWENVEEDRSDVTINAEMAEGEDEAERRESRDYVRVLSVYSPQLHLLQLNLPMDDFYLHLGAPMLLAALRASELRELSLGVWQDSPGAGCNPDVTWVSWFADVLPTLQPRPTLQHVGDLVVYGLPLNDHELSCLLLLFPNVQDCRLGDLNCLFLDALPMLGRACPKLRKLEVIADVSNAFLQHPLTDVAWTADERSVVLFPNLLALVVAGRYNALQCDKRHLQPLARLLSLFAPNLRYLYLDINSSLELLTPFSALPCLRAFRAFLHVPAALTRFFRRPPADERARIWSEFHRDRPQYKCEVMSQYEMECMEKVRDVKAGWDAVWLTDRVDSYVFASSDSGWAGGGWDESAVDAAGQWGRQGFFDALSAVSLIHLSVPVAQ